MLSSPLNVCFVTDGKPGHKNQLMGLEQSLQLLTNVQSQWLRVEDVKVSWFDVLCRRMESSLSSVPDMVVGAGSSTHRLVLALKRKYGSFSVILMKPSVLPLRWFDALVIPEHDHPYPRSNILVTEGVLNTIRPSEIAEPSKQGLFLIGGESKHYQWDDAQVVEQIQQLINRIDSVDHWHLTDSRRTPPQFRHLIRDHMKGRVTFYPHQDTPLGWVGQQLSQADQVWVTPDSVSMVYESITSGKATGLFDLVPNKKSRIVAGIEALISKGRVMTVSGKNKSALVNAPLCESDRAAEWLLSRFTETRLQRGKNIG